MREHVLLYGLVCGVLIAGLQFIEYRWLVGQYSVEIYGALVAGCSTSSARGGGPRRCNWEKNFG